MKVEIKERRLPTGNRSLYLEYYETGFRKKEYLGIFLVPEDSARARRLNGEALRKAQEIKAKRILCPPDFKSVERKKHQKKDTVNPTWLEWCDEYIRWSEDCGNSRKMLQHKGVVRKRIASYLENRGKKGILLKDVDREVVSGLFDFMRNEYRNPRQIKTDGGKLADYTLLLFEETVKAIFNKAMR